MTKISEIVIGEGLAMIAKIKILMVIAVVILIMSFGVVVGYWIHPDIPALSNSEKRNIAIDFMAKSGTWKHTLCTTADISKMKDLPPMDSKEPQ